jgi:hypothetical protein
MEWIFLVRSLNISASLSEEAAYLQAPTFPDSFLDSPLAPSRFGDRGARSLINSASLLDEAAFLQSTFPVSFSASPLVSTTKGNFIFRNYELPH